MSLQHAAAFVRRLGIENLDATTLRSVKNCILDFIGAVLGATHTKAAGMARLSCPRTEGGMQATLWVNGAMVPIQHATFWNGTVGCSLDIDDGHRMAVGHPGSVMIPAAVAIAETNQCSGVQLLEAIVCGYEVGIRSGDIHRHETSPFAIIPGTGRWGSLGAAAAVAKILRLSQSQIEQALAISATFAPLSPVIDDLSNGFMPMTKYCSGWGGVVGLCAAQLAQGGFTGISSVVDFSKSVLPKFASSYEINNVYFKPYPCCRWMHPILEGVIGLIHQYDELRSENIKKIVVKTFKAASHLKDPRPRTMESAQYSIPFMVGMAIIDGDILPDNTADGRLNDLSILSVADKVEIIYSDALEKLFPQQIPTEIEIESHSGRCYGVRVDKSKGDPGNPIPPNEFHSKFKRLAAKRISAQVCNELVSKVRKLEKIEDINEITALLKNPL